MSDDQELIAFDDNDEPSEPASSGSQAGDSRVPIHRINEEEALRQREAATPLPPERIVATDRPRPPDRPKINISATVTQVSDESSARPGIARSVWNFFWPSNQRWRRVLTATLVAPACITLAFAAYLISGNDWANEEFARCPLVFKPVCLYQLGTTFTREVRSEIEREDVALVFAIFIPYEKLGDLSFLLYDPRE